MTYCEMDCCKNCERLELCGGCDKCKGHPFGGSCIAERNKNFKELKNSLINEINSLNIEYVFVNDLYLLCGSFVNLEYDFKDNKKMKFLNDSDIYLGNQIEIPNSNTCIGITANEDFILISKYEEYGMNPEIILYKRRWIKNICRM